MLGVREMNKFGGKYKDYIKNEILQIDKSIEHLD